MAFTRESKRQGYDNIAAAGAAGVENIVAVGPTTQDGPGDVGSSRLSMSQRGTSTSNLSQGLPERWINRGTSNDNNNNQPTSDLIPAQSYTSGTSDTSVFMERLG